MLSDHSMQRNCSQRPRNRRGVHEIAPLLSPGSSPVHLLDCHRRRNDHGDPRHLHDHLCRRRSTPPVLQSLTKYFFLFSCILSGFYPPWFSSLYILHIFPKFPQIFFVFPPVIDLNLIGNKFRLDLKNNSKSFFIEIGHDQCFCEKYNLMQFERTSKMFEFSDNR